MILGHRQIEPGQGHAAGRELLKQLYSEYFDGVDGEMPAIAVTPQGKPYFLDSSIQFSITHTKHHVFCVLSDRPVGIDAEELDRNIDLRLAEKILSDSEKAQYAQVRDKRLALLRFWVLKEAAVKCSGEGLQGYPNKTDFSLNDPALQETDGCLVAVIER